MMRAEYLNVLQRALTVPLPLGGREDAPVLRVTLAKDYPSNLALGASGMRGPWGSRELYFNRAQVRRMLAKAEQDLIPTGAIQNAEVLRHDRA
jgi:hypothetical protein